MLTAAPRVPWAFLSSPSALQIVRPKGAPLRCWPRRVSWSWVAVTAGLSTMARATARRVNRVDSHLHLWTPDEATYPWQSAPPEHLNNDGRATTESFVKLMDENGIEKAVVVQPINYGQDYKYVLSALQSHPDRLLGVFVADATVAEPEKWMEDLRKSHRNWVGVRFNPYKWPEGHGMADDIGKRLFRQAGELALPVGVMPFKGLSQHADDLEELLKFNEKTQVIIDHWGFFLQPATGFGERQLDEASWTSLLRLSKYPQVHVKISALFRVSPDGMPWLSLSDRLKELLKTFGSQRLLWGSDFPYATEHSTYAEAVQALEAWPVWQEMSEEDRRNVLHDTAAKLYGLPLLPKEEL